VQQCTNTLTTGMHVIKYDKQYLNLKLNLYNGVINNMHICATSTDRHCTAKYNVCKHKQ